MLLTDYELTEDDFNSRVSQVRARGLAASAFPCNAQSLGTAFCMCLRAFRVPFHLMVILTALCTRPRNTQENFMHINLTTVEQSVARLIDEQQEAVVVSAHHPLSQHKQLLAALWKARRSKSEQALDQASKGECCGGSNEVLICCLRCFTCCLRWPP